MNDLNMKKCCYKHKRYLLVWLIQSTCTSINHAVEMQRLLSGFMLFPYSVENI